MSNKEINYDAFVLPEGASESDLKFNLPIEFNPEAANLLAKNAKFGSGVLEQLGIEVANE